MLRRTFLAALLASPALAALLQGCGDDDGGSSQTGEVRSDVARVSAEQSLAGPAVASLDGFGTTMYRRLAAAQPAGNLVMSPASIAIALTMASAGAKGATLDEMLATLEVADAAGIHRSMNALTAALDARNGDDVQLSVVNSLWGQRDLEFVAAFVDLLAQEYGAGMNLVDYKSDAEGARRAINSWVSDATEDRIPELLGEGELSSDSRLTLVNAIYMKAAWLDPFSDTGTQDAPFTRLDGSVVDVPMMHLTRQIGYAAGDGWQAVELPYRNGELAMLVFVIEEGFQPDFEATFLVSDASLYLEPRRVALGLPKFDIETKAALADVLAAMGMQLAFTDDADFSGISADEPMQISAVVHQANITVDEQGTEAAAATAVEIGATSAPVEDEPISVVADHPFVFAVRDRSTGAVLFLGRVGDPSQTRT